MTAALKNLSMGLFRNNFLPYSETFIHDELRHHERYNATVFARQWRNKEMFPGHNVIAVEEVPDKKRFWASNWYGLTGQSKKIEAVFKRKSFDILHAHFCHNGLYALPYAQKYKVPLVISLHGRDVTILLGNDKYKPAFWLYLFQYKKLFDQADLFLAASTELKELIQRVGCPSEKVIVNRLGIDVGLFSPAPANRETDPAVIVMVGRFVEKKGHEYGIRAVAKARDAGLNVKLALVGDGPLHSRYKRLVSSLNLDEQVAFLGSLPHEKVCELMTRATVVLAPSVVAKNLDRESGIIVAKEAAACGVPTIGTYHGGIPDIIDDGKTGYLVPERNAELLGDRLIQLLTNDPLREQMSKAARAKMEAEYDIRERIQSLEVIYDGVIKNYKK